MSSKTPYTQTDHSNSTHGTTDSVRARIERAGSLHWAHWTVVIMSLVLTVSAWQFAQRQVDEKNHARFDRETEQVINLIVERLQNYEDALRSAVAFVETTPNALDADTWRDYTTSLSLAERYPGINGLGIIERIERDQSTAFIASQQQQRPDFRIFPEHAQDILLPITLIEPVSTNAAALGLDIAHESNRFSAALLAGDSGTAQITGPIVLVQDAARTPGFLFYLPFYTDSSKPAAEFAGLVYAPFVVNKLMGGTLAKQSRHVGIAIKDAGETLYNELTAEHTGFDRDAMFSTARTVDVYGRTWTFDVQSNLSFRGAVSSSTPAFILAGGITIDILLLTLFVLLSNANRRAIAYADDANRELRNTTERLSQSNQELEKFAYVASHDLKTPLRGINDLTDFLTEDLNSYLNDQSANPDVAKNLARIHDQTRRMQNLIESILRYASVDQSRAADWVDCNTLVQQVLEDMSLDASKVVYNELPQLYTSSVLLQQVFSNLISNSFKYSGNPDDTRVEISVIDHGYEYEFKVADNGPGIDPRFHDRIFEIFQTLQPKRGDSTGIGLAIVKKIIETAGGNISIQSATGKGAVFTFTWPKSNQQLIPQQDVA